MEIIFPILIIKTLTNLLMYSNMKLFNAKVIQSGNKIETFQLDLQHLKEILF